MKLIAILIHVLLIASCANINELYEESFDFARTTRLTDNYDLVRMNIWTLPLDSKIYVGSEPESTTSVIRRKISDSAFMSFNSIFGFVSKASKAASYDDSLRQARRAGYEYLLYPKVIYTQDAVSTWEEAQVESHNRKPLGLDQARLQLILAQTNGYVVDVVNIQGNSGLLTFYGDQPIELIEEPITKYALALAAK